jgi:hypothetical protein
VSWSRYIVCQERNVFLSGAGVVIGWNAMHGSLARFYYFMRKGKGKRGDWNIFGISCFSYW